MITKKLKKLKLCLKITHKKTNKNNNLKNKTSYNKHLISENFNNNKCIPIKIDENSLPFGNIMVFR